MSSERIRRVAETVQRHIDAKDVAGAVTLVARRGKIVEFEAQVSLAGTSRPSFPLTEKLARLSPSFIPPNSASGKLKGFPDFPQHRR